MRHFRCEVCHAHCSTDRNRTRFCGIACANRARTVAPQRRFLRFITVTNTCWLWEGVRDADGYGRFGPTRHKRYGAHRFAYELFVGPIPEGLQLDHLCRTPACVRPDHLEPVTAQENTLRGASIVADNARKVRCGKGHEFEDLGYRRFCRTCKRDADRQRRMGRSA